MKIQDVFREEAHSRMMETLRLKLVDLPERTVDEEATKTKAKTFAQRVFNQHAHSVGGHTTADLSAGLCGLC